MPRPVAKVVTNENQERTIEGNEGVEGIENPRKVTFTECENKLKTGAKKVFPAEKNRPGSGSRKKIMTGRKPGRKLGKYAKRKRESGYNEERRGPASYLE